MINYFPFALIERSIWNNREQQSWYFYCFLSFFVFRVNNLPILQTFSLPKLYSDFPLNFVVLKFYKSRFKIAKRKPELIKNNNLKIY